MTEVGFYHLTRSRLAEALPKLLVRTLGSGQRALVVGRDDAELAALSEALWAVPEWLPHGTQADGDAALQPIWLTTERVAPNGARFLFLTGGRDAGDLTAFDRVFDLFDGTDPDAVQSARRRWKEARDAGHTLTYLQQTETGWQRKA